MEQKTRTAILLHLLLHWLVTTQRQLSNRKHSREQFLVSPSRGLDTPKQHLREPLRRLRIPICRFLDLRPPSSLLCIRIGLSNRLSRTIILVAINPVRRPTNSPSRLQLWLLNSNTTYPLTASPSPSCLGGRGWWPVSIFLLFFPRFFSSFYVSLISQILKGSLHVIIDSLYPFSLLFNPPCSIILFSRVIINLWFRIASATERQLAWSSTFSLVLKKCV